MSVNRSAPIFGSGSRIWTAVLDVFKWTTYSSLHKWIVVSFAALSLSWQFSLWTLLPLFIIASVAGVKVSEEILHNRKTSHFAELLFYKLESAYIEIRTVVKQLKIIYSGGPHLKNDSTLQAQLISELSSVYEIDDKSNDVPVRLSAELKLELNSIQLLIIRDFVRSWYADFSYDPQFLKETKYYLQESFNSLVMHLAQQDPQILLTKVVKLYHFHFAMYQKARNMYESHKVYPNIKVPEDSRFKRHSSLCDAFESTLITHPALESEDAELRYLRGVVSMLVLSACNPHLVEGSCVKTLLVQILTNKVMLPVMKMMSNPDWLMEVIIILTSDEKVIGDEDMSVSNAESVMENTERNDKTFVSSTRRMSPGQPDSDLDSNLEWHEHLEDDELVKSKLYSQTKYSQLPSDLEEFDRQVWAGDVCLLSKHNFDHDSSQSLPALDPRAEDLKQLQSDKQQCPTSSNVVQDLITNNAQSNIPNGTCDQTCSVKHVENKQSLSKDIPLMKNSFSNELAIESLSSLTAVREECFAEGESDTDTFFDEPFTLVNDPQKIMSFRQRSSSSFDSDTWSATGNSTDRGSLSSESDASTALTYEADTNSETVTSSFPKLSSIKSFFVDSLKTGGKQQFVKKPKSLSLFSEKLASNFNPLTQKKRLKSKSNGHNSQEPPQLFVDGVPLYGQDVKPEDSSHVSSVPTSVDDQPTPTYSDLEMTPSPGFFSSVNSFFHLSSSQNDMHKLCEGEGQKVSLTPTLSPTGLTDFGIGAIAVIKDSSCLKPFELDDRRIFQDVTIPETSICTEFRSTTQYSLYNIQYEALYFTEEGKSVIRSGAVRRRYREFVSLQSRLESHPGYKKYLRNMKVPKRWATIPFKSIDKETVETRRLFLERYLKDLTEIEAICNGPDLREFLAYEGDSHIAFVKKSPDITVPRFDKMFMRGVSEVVDRIKALPNIPQEMMSGLRGRETPDDRQIRSRIHFDANTIDVNTAFHMDMISETSNILPMTSLQVLQDLDTEDDKDLIHNVITDPRNIEQTNEAYKQEVEKVLAALPRVQGDRTDLHDAKAADPSMSLTVLDLLVQGLQQHDHWICRERVVKSMHSVLGKALNRYLETSISALTTNQELANYLKLLRETIWPRGQLWSKSSPPKTDDQRQATREQAKRCLVNFFPVSLRLVIGHKEFETMITSFLSSLESEKMNRHILYLILDMLVEQLFPEVTSHDLLHSLLFSRSRSAHAP